MEPGSILILVVVAIVAIFIIISASRKNKKIIHPNKLVPLIKEIIENSEFRKTVNEDSLLSQYIIDSLIKDEIIKGKDVIIGKDGIEEKEFQILIDLGFIKINKDDSFFTIKKEKIKISRKYSFSSVQYIVPEINVDTQEIKNMDTFYLEKIKSVFELYEKSLVDLKDELITYLSKFHTELAKPKKIKIDSTNITMFKDILNISDNLTDMLRLYNKTVLERINDINNNPLRYDYTQFYNSIDLQLIYFDKLVKEYDELIKSFNKKDYYNTLQLIRLFAIREMTISKETQYIVDNLSIVFRDLQENISNKIDDSSAKIDSKLRSVQSSANIAALTSAAGAYLSYKNLKKSSNLEKSLLGEPQRNKLY